MGREIKVGIIGLGYWGKNILRNLYELGAVGLACDSNETTIAEHRKHYPDLSYTTHIDEVLSHPDIPAVVLSTPAATHYALVKKALLAGKDVYVEKPLALTFPEGKELVELAKKQGRILMVGHILQYHPAILKLKDLVKSGELGKIQYIFSNRLNIGKLRVEENIIWSFAPHDISVILMLLGEEPKTIRSSGASYLNEGIYDVTLTSMEFKNHVQAHVFVSWIHPFKEQKLVVVGSQAMVVFDDTSKEKLFLYPHQIKWEDGKIPVAHKAEYRVVPIDSGEPLKIELQHFLDCVANRKTPRTDGEEGLRVLKVLEQIEKNMGA